MTDYTIHQGRPEDEKRSETEMHTYDLLDQLNIPFERIDHDPAASIDDCDDVDKALGVDICKNLFLTNSDQSDFYLLVMPGHKKFHSRTVARQIGSTRLSFASAEQLYNYLKVIPGSVSVLALMNDTAKKVQLLADDEVFHSRFFACHPCANTTSLKLQTADVFSTFLKHISHAAIPVEI